MSTCGTAAFRLFTMLIAIGSIRGFPSGPTYGLPLTSIVSILGKTWGTTPTFLRSRICSILSLLIHNRTKVGVEIRCDNRYCQQIWTSIAQRIGIGRRSSRSYSLVLASPKRLKLPIFSCIGMPSTFWLINTGKSLASAFLLYMTSWDGLP